MDAPCAPASRRLLLPAPQLAALRRYAAAAYPEECCGILLGRARAGGARVEVEEVWPAANAHPGSRARRYSIDPRALVAAHRRARSGGVEVVGYYHSHPDHPAVPSADDREHAWPGTSYLILGMAPDAAGEVRSWRLDAGGAFAEEEVET